MGGCTSSQRKQITQEERRLLTDNACQKTDVNLYSSRQMFARVSQAGSLLVAMTKNAQ